MATKEKEFKVRCGCGEEFTFKRRNTRSRVVCGNRGTTITKVRYFKCPICGHEIPEDEWDEI